MADVLDETEEAEPSSDDRREGPVGGERWAMGVLATNVIAVPAVAFFGIAGGAAGADLIGLLAAVVLVVGLSLIQMSVVRSQPDGR